MLAQEPPAAQAPSTQAAPKASPTAQSQGSAGAATAGIAAVAAGQPQDALATLLARAVRRRHEPGVADPDRSAVVLARRAQEGTVDLAVRMLELPVSASGPPSEDPLMAQARAKGLRGLWEMRLAAVWGGVADPRSGAWSWRAGSPGERITVLERSAGIVRGGLSAAEQARFDAAVAAARAHVFDEGLAQKLDSRAAEQVYETPDIALEAMRGTVAAALDTVAKLDALKVLRPIATNATRFTPEHAALWRELAADPKYKGNAFIQRYAKQGVPQFIYVLKGVLSGIDLALKVTDEKKRAKLLHAVGSEYDVSFRGGVHDVMVIVQAGEALFTAGGMFVYASMRALGMADDAAIWFKAFTAAKPAEGLSKLALAKANYLTDLGWRIPLRTLSFVSSGLQLVHGVAVLLNSSSTDSERLEAYWEGGLGIAGLAGAGATGLNITWLAGIAGPATAALLAGGLATYLGRANIRELQIANSTEYVAWLFDYLQTESAQIAQEANKLEQTLRLGEHAQASSGSEVAAAADRRAERQAQALHDSMVLVFLDLANPGLHVPKHVKAPFVTVKRRVSGAKTPRQTLAAGVTFLNIVRDLFRHFQRTVARSLVELDRDYKEKPFDWRDPLELFRGLHDDRRVRAQAAEGEAAPAPVSLEFELGPVTAGGRSGSQRGGSSRRRSK